MHHLRTVRIAKQVLELLTDAEILKILGRAEERPCCWCDGPIDPRANAQRIYCSDDCRWKSLNASRTPEVSRKYKADYRARQKAKKQKRGKRT